MTGGLLVQQQQVFPFFGGGIRGLTIDGNASGFISASAIFKLVIGGSYSGPGSITAGQLFGNLGPPDATCEGDLGAGIEIRQELRGGINVLQRIEGARIRVLGGVIPSATITVNQIVSPYGYAPDNYCPLIDLNGDHGNTAGKIIFQNVIAANDVVVHGALNSPGSIDFNGSDIYGTIDVRGGGSGNLLDGGIVRDHAIIRLGPDSPVGFAGKADFQALEDLPNVPAGALVEIGSLAGGVRFKENVSGRIRAASVQGKAAITCEGSLSGTIEVAGNCGGSISVDRDLEASGEVTIDGNLTSSGRVVIEGKCRGQVAISRQTDKLSLIHLVGGLEAGSSVSVNAGMGQYDANGTIHVGIAEFAPSPPVIFDGAVRVRGNAGGGGNLNGEIRVVGCHETGDRLDICVCGAINGTVAIEQKGCPSQVGWTCQSGCP